MNIKHSSKFWGKAIKTCVAMIVLITIIIVINGCTHVVTKSFTVPNYVDRQVPVEEVKYEQGKEIITRSTETRRVQEGTKVEERHKS